MARSSALSAIGGGAASEYWLQVIATTLGIPLKLPEGREFGAALGAARLARISVTGSAPGDAMPSVEVGQMIEPDRERIQEFDDAYQAFRHTYTGVRAIH